MKSEIEIEIVKRLREKKRELDEEEEEREEEQVKSVDQELEMIKEIQILRQTEAATVGEDKQDKVCLIVCLYVWNKYLCVISFTCMIVFMQACVCVRACICALVFMGRLMGS